jgi:hypothetical protein
MVQHEPVYVGLAPFGPLTVMLPYDRRAIPQYVRRLFEGGSLS